MSTSGPGSTEASFYTVEGGKVRCSLCPHSCLIADRSRGRCGVRENRGGRLYSLTYGLASSVHLDPIEKKPLFHFLPGSSSLSLGSVGCNLSCLHCQNYSISRAGPDDIQLTEMSAKDVVDQARECGAESVSWTYNEPTIWHEFAKAASEAAHGSGLKTNYVTNGYIQEAPLRDLKGVIDAMNIDVKAFTEEFYRRVCGGHLEPVLRTCELAVELGMHAEITYLIIPGHNDSEQELQRFSEWVAGSLGRDVPVHFSAFHPDYKLTSVPRTPQSRMDMAFEIARKAGLEFVYLGNIRAGDRDDTFCPNCRELVIERDGFRVSKSNLRDGRCGKCGAGLNIVV